MVVAIVQDQARQDLVKSKSEDKTLIEMSISVFQKVAPKLQLDLNSNPFGKLLQLINNISANFESLEKATTKQVLDTFKELCMQTF